MLAIRVNVDVAVGIALLCHAACLVRAQGAASLCPQLPTAAECAATNTCQWNEFVNECTAKCDAEAFSYNQQACEANPSCSWVYGQCVPSCPMLVSPTTCNNGMMCAWDATRNTCATNCTLSRMRLPESQCRFFPMCKPFVDPRTHQPHCVPGCRSFLGEALCKQHPQDCLWNASDRVCVPPPAPTPAPTPNPTPAPYNPRLPGECHHRATDPASCAAAQCVWNPFLMMCSQPCYLPNANESTCLSNPSCSWFSGSCARRCDIVEEEVMCNSIPPCGWNLLLGKCVAVCARATTRTACDTYSECRLGPGSSCVKSCRSHPDRARCAQDPICRWDASTLTCS